MIAIHRRGGNHLIVSLFREIFFGMDEKLGGVGNLSGKHPGARGLDNQPAEIYSHISMDVRLQSVIGERPIIARRGITQAVCLF